MRETAKTISYFTETLYENTTDIFFFKQLETALANIFMYAVGTRVFAAKQRSATINTLSPMTKAHGALLARSR